MKHAAINTSEIGYFPRRSNNGNYTSTAEITIVTIALYFRTSRASYALLLYFFLLSLCVLLASQFWTIRMEKLFW